LGVRWLMLAADASCRAGSHFQPGMCCGNYTIQALIKKINVSNQGELYSLRALRCRRGLVDVSRRHRDVQQHYHRYTAEQH